MGIGAQAFDNGDIMRRLRNMERSIRELTSGRRLENSSVGAGGLRIHSGGNALIEDGGGLALTGGGAITIDGGSLTMVDPEGQQILEMGTDVSGKVGMLVRSDGVIRSENFDGYMAASDAGTRGWALGHNRMAVLGAMVAPVDFHSDFGSGNNFSFGGTEGPVNDKITLTVPVPDWADEAGVMAFSMISAQNNSASDDSINGRSIVDGIEGQAFNKTVSVGEIFDVSLGQSETLTVTGRASFDVKIRVWSGGNFWPADNTNNAALSLLVVFRGVA